MRCLGHLFVIITNLGSWWVKETCLFFRQWLGFKPSYSSVYRRTYSFFGGLHHFLDFKNSKNDHSSLNHGVRVHPNGLAIWCILYVQSTFLDISFSNIHQVSVVFGDNKPAICSVGNESAKSRTKHLDVRFKFCGEVVRAGLLQIKLSTINIADIFTKPLAAPRFRLLCDKLVKDLKLLIWNSAKDCAKFIFTASNIARQNSEANQKY